MLKKALKNERGLTLVELLAVIVILGIIAAIAVPSIGHLINKTNDKAKVADAVQIIDAAKLYVSSEGMPDGKTTLVLNKNNLDSYLDNVKSKKNFKVTVSKDQNGKITYSISGHEANSIATDKNGDGRLSESELTDWLNNNQ